jgi:cell division protein FtsB
VAAARASSIRWDRVGRTALLGVLGMILLLYVSPLTHWVAQSRTADEQRAELRRLESEHRRLADRAAALERAGAIEREARALGMVRRGERAYVIQR